MYFVEFWYDDGTWKYEKLDHVEFEEVLMCIDNYYSVYLKSVKVRCL